MHCSCVTRTARSPSSQYTSPVLPRAPTAALKIDPAIALRRRAAARNSDRLTSANTVSVATELASASRSNGTVNASTTISTATIAVAINGVPVPRMHIAEDARQIALARHAIDDARRHGEFGKNGVERRNDGNRADGRRAHLREFAKHHAERRRRTASLSSGTAVTEIAAIAT